MFSNYTEELNSKFILEIQTLNQYRTLDFYYLIDTYGRVMAGYLDYFDAWIYSTGNRCCVGLWVNGNYLLNSKNLNNQDLLIINDRINFEQFKKRFHFSSDKKIIQLITKFNPYFFLKKIKER